MELTERELRVAVARNRAALHARFGSIPGGRAWVDGDGAFVDSGVPFAIFNGVFLAGSARAFATEVRASSRPALVWVGEGCDRARLELELRELGAVPQGSMQDFAVDLASVPSRRRGVAETQLAEGALARPWAEIVLGAFELPAWTVDAFAAALSAPDADPGRKLINFIVLHEAQPVAAASVFFAEGIAGIYNVSVSKGWRHLDLGRSVLSEVGRLARAEGCRYVGGSAFDDVMPFYERMPLLRLGRTDIYQV